MTDLNGLVLGGGRSSRMGEDKSLMDYHGLPQRDYLFLLLKPFCNEVFFSCRREQQDSSLKNQLIDQFEIETPLNGILSAFQKHPDTAWITVPVDMPNIGAAAVDFLIQHRNKEKVASCFYDSEGDKPEPLFTVWEPRAFPMLLKFYERGGASPRAFLLSHAVEVVVAPDRDWLFNINTREEWVQWQEGQSKRGS